MTKDSLEYIFDNKEESKKSIDRLYASIYIRNLKEELSKRKKYSIGFKRKEDGELHFEFDRSKANNIIFTGEVRFPEENDDFLSGTFHIEYHNSTLLIIYAANEKLRKRILDEILESD